MRLRLRFGTFRFLRLGPVCVVFPWCVLRCVLCVLKFLRFVVSLFFAVNPEMRFNGLRLCFDRPAKVEKMKSKLINQLVN